jgi:hypothetical protein
MYLTKKYTRKCNFTLRPFGNNHPSCSTFHENHLQIHGLSPTVINKCGKYRFIFTHAFKQLTATPTIFVCTIKIGRKNVGQSGKIFVRHLHTAQILSERFSRKSFADTRTVTHSNQQNVESIGSYSLTPSRNLQPPQQFLCALSKSDART